MQGIDVKTDIGEIDEIDDDVTLISEEKAFLKQKKGILYFTYLLIKRVFDIIGSLIGIVILIPATFVI